MRLIMNELTTFTFADAASGDEACVVIRYGDDSVAIAVSLSNDGDVEVVMRKQELTKLIDALTDAKNSNRSQSGVASGRDFGYGLRWHGCTPACFAGRSGRPAGGGSGPDPVAGPADRPTPP